MAKKIPSETKQVSDKTFTLLLRVEFGQDKTKAAQAESLMEILEAGAEKKNQEFLIERKEGIVEFWVCLQK